MQKKYIIVLITFFFTFSLMGCENKADAPDVSNNESVVSYEDITEGKKEVEIATKDYISETSEPETSLPTFADEMKAFYDNAEEGRLMTYEYNEEKDKWYCVFQYGDISLCNLGNSQVELRYNGNNIVLPWRMNYIGTGSGMSVDMMDVTNDGEDDLILRSYTRECQAIYVFDLVKWADISPGYGFMSLYADSEAVIEEMNKTASADGYGEAYILPIGNSDGTLMLNLYRNGDDIISTALNEDGSIVVTYKEVIRVAEMITKFCYIYDGDRYVLEDFAVSTRAGRHKEELLSVEKTECSMEGEVRFDNQKKQLEFIYGKDDVEIRYVAGLSDFSGGCRLEITKADNVCQCNWISRESLADMLFELKDVDGDGLNELVYCSNHYEFDGVEEKMYQQVQIFDFESMSELISDTKTDAEFESTK